jgi:hypothetical protein
MTPRGSEGGCCESAVCCVFFPTVRLPTSCNEPSLLRWTITISCNPPAPPIPCPGGGGGGGDVMAAVRALAVTIITSEREALGGAAAAAEAELAKALTARGAGAAAAAESGAELAKALTARGAGAAAAAEVGVAAAAESAAPVGVVMPAALFLAMLKRSLMDMGSFIAEPSCVGRRGGASGSGCDDVSLLLEGMKAVGCGVVGFRS